MQYDIKLNYFLFVFVFIFSFNRHSSEAVRTAVASSAMR